MKNKIELEKKNYKDKNYNHKGLEIQFRIVSCTVLTKILQNFD